MRALTPWTGMMALRREMDRLFDRFFEPIEEVEPVGGWTPRIDLKETKDAFVVTAEVPGVNPKDVEVSLQERTLTIKGEKKQEKEEKGETWHRVERAWGAFARAMTLPAAVDAEKVTATFKDGVLTVSLPKTAAAKGKAIPIKEAA